MSDEDRGSEGHPLLDFAEEVERKRRLLDYEFNQRLQKSWSECFEKLKEALEEAGIDTQDGADESEDAGGCEDADRDEGDKCPWCHCPFCGRKLERPRDGSCCVPPYWSFQPQEKTWPEVEPYRITWLYPPEPCSERTSTISNC